MTIIMMITTVNDNDDHDQSHHPHHSLPRKASPGKTMYWNKYTGRPTKSLSSCRRCGWAYAKSPAQLPAALATFSGSAAWVRKSGCWDNESNVKLKHKDLLKPCEYSILIHMKQIIQYWYVLICIYWICSYLLMSNKMSLTIMMIFNVVEIPFYLPIFDPERWDEKNLNAFDESAGASPWQDGYGSVTSTPAVCAIRTVARRAGIFWIQRFNGKNGKK